MRSRSPRRCATRVTSDRGTSARRRQQGAAAVEFALVLPIILLMVLSLWDIARTIQATMILTAMGREGASLASRSSGYTQPQIMDALAETTPPLNMTSNGMIYITRVMGLTVSGAVRNVVIEQYRWQAGFATSKYAPKSAVWTCGDSGGTSWSTADGKCSGLPSPGATSPTTTLMAGKLASGQAMYAVETFYRYTPLMGTFAVAPGLSTPTTDPNLYSMTVF